MPWYRRRSANHHDAALVLRQGGSYVPPSITYTDGEEVTHVVLDEAQGGNIDEITIGVPPSTTFEGAV